MKIAIMSDTHDNVQRIMTAMERIAQEEVACIIHAGDFVAPFSMQRIFEMKGDVQFVGVLGNNDGERQGLKAIAGDTLHEPPFTFELEKKRFYVTHDATKLDLDDLSKSHDIIIFGHTHKLLIERKNSTLIINPGECCGILSGKSSFVILELPDMSTRAVPF